jgi:predicted branched-subunit amino acid permease
MTDPVASLRDSFREGVRDATPIFVGLLPTGAVTGIAIAGAGLGYPEALASSTIMFSGMAQIAVVELVSVQAPLVIVMLTVMMINLRYLLYSATLGTVLRRESFFRRSTLTYFLTDTLFARTISRTTDPDFNPSIFWAYSMGIGIISVVSWIVGTSLGFFAGDSIPKQVPMDFAVPMMILALLFPILRSAPMIIAALFGGGVALAAAGMPANLSILIGSLTGIVAGTTATIVAQNRRP